MVYRVQFMAEGEELPILTHTEFHRLSLEVRVSETWKAVYKAFNQAHELVRFVLEKIAKQEDFPRGPEAIRFLNVWTSRAFQFMEWSGNEFRASCVDTCAHDSALRFAGQAGGSFTMAGIENDDEYLRKQQLPDLWATNDRLNVEKARTLERVREKTNRVIGKTQLSEGNQTAEWPPDEQWHFREGEAAFRGVAFEIQGVPWRLLKKLAEKSGTPVGKAALLDAINVVEETGNVNGNAGEEALRSHLSRLRNILRKAFRLSRKLDPLPNVERGMDAAWRLDESVFPSVSEIQRWLNGR